MTGRCGWCGQYVARGTPPAVRTVRGSRDGVLAWRTFVQVLCPTCRPYWTHDSPWNKAYQPPPPTGLHSSAQRL